MEKYYQKLSVAFSVLCCLFLVNSAMAQTVTDKELKKNTTPLNNTLSAISQLEPVTYEYNNGQEYKKLSLPAGRQYGLIAEDVQKVFPNLVKTTYKMVPAGKNNYKTITIKTIDYNSLIPLLIASVKEQQEEIETLKGELQKLKVAAK